MIDQWEMILTEPGYTCASCGDTAYYSHRVDDVYLCETHAEMHGYESEL